VNDLGGVATARGEWEVSIGGAAGANERKSAVLCRETTQAEAITIIGRFLISYRDNAKWRERTYDFVPRIGLEKVREIIVNDTLNLGESFDVEVETARAYARSSSCRTGSSISWSGRSETRNAKRLWEGFLGRVSGDRALKRTCAIWLHCFRNKLQRTRRRAIAGVVATPLRLRASATPRLRDSA
jgi:hypothetical protein